MKTITTLLAALALVALAAACTSELEAGIEGRTITVDLGTKPAYTEPNTDNPNTRTNHTTGQWEVGDKVEVTFTFYDGGTSLGTQKQTLTCIKAATTTTTPVVTAQWSAAPAILIAPGAAAKVDALYKYTSAPDPRTGTREEIGIYTKPTTLPTTGTLAMTAPKWLRGTALVVVKNIPDGSTATIESTSSNTPAQWTNNTGAPASANFHLPTGALNPTFTLKITTAGTETTPYTNVPYKAGHKCTLGATPGTGGGDVQYINVDGNKRGDEIAAIFSSAASTNFCITGTGTTNVKDALNNNALVTSGKKLNLLMPEVTTVAANAFELCTALTTISLPAAESIGKGAFYRCTALTTISLPAAESIEETAFENCASLTTISLPAATSIERRAFRDCTALGRLELTAATAITVDSDAFVGIPNIAGITLVLHSTAQNQGNAMGISVSDKDVTFANTVNNNSMPITITVDAVEFAN